MDKKRNLSLNSLNIEEWLDAETNKHVQFSETLPLLNKPSKSVKSNQSISNLTTSKKEESIRLPNIFNETTNNPSKYIYNRSASITDTNLYRSSYNRSLSISTRSSLSPTNSRRSSLLSNRVIKQINTPSIISSCGTNSSINKTQLPSLELNVLLDENDRKKLNKIHRLIPEEFEKLVPILFKLGLIIVPNYFFGDNQNYEQLTTKQLIERHYFISLIKKYEERLQHKIYLEHVYGNSLFYQNNNHLLREILSYKGQLALINCYQDEIEYELNKKIPLWKTISLISIRDNVSEYSYSTKRSSLITNPSKYNKQALSIQTNISLSLNKDDQLLANQIDNQWKRKSIPFFIEQGFILLDRIRLLVVPIFSDISSEQLNIHQNNQINFVQAFKRWVFLWSTLYEQD